MSSPPEESLFEGMVLFDSTISPSPPPPLQLPPTPSSSQPLDSDLFSDLTLLTPPPEPIPSRLPSRKKKRGFRVGYAREPRSDLDDAPDKDHLRSEVSVEEREDFGDGGVKVVEESGSEFGKRELGDGDVKAVGESGLEDGEVGGEVQLEKLGLELGENEIGDGEVKAVGESGSGFGKRELGDGEVRGEVQLEKSPLEVGENEMGDGEREVVETSGGIEKDEFCVMEERLGLVRDRIAEKLGNLRETAEKIIAERKEVGRRRRMAEESVSKAGVRFRELEMELEEACEREDFERAEAVSLSLADVEKEKDELLRRLREAEGDCEAVDSRMQEVLEMQIAAEEEGMLMLEKLAKEAADNAETVLKNAENISSIEVEEWEVLSESLEVKTMEMDVQMHLVDEARSGLESSIEQLVQDDRKEMEHLCTKQQLLNKELEELLALVRLKEAEIAENNNHIAEVEKRISNVVQKFNDTRSGVATKFNDLQSALSTIESERSALSMRKKSIDEQHAVAESITLKLRELADGIAEEAKTYKDFVKLRKSLASPISSSREEKQRLARIEASISEDIHSLKEQISASRSSLQEISSNRSIIQEEIASIKQRISFIDKRGPELEAEKKVAAAARNFKEAGRIAAEAKALSTEKESIQNKMDKAVSELQELEVKITNTLNSIEENESLIATKEKEAAKAGFERLHLVAATARAERSAALELGDTEEADVLLQEVEAAESKAAEFHQAYGIVELDNSSKDHISIALVTRLSGKKLAEVASSLNLPVSGCS